MLSEREKQFLQSWEKERGGFSTVSSKLLRGLPMAMLFSLPVILFIFVVYIFFPDWYYKISQTSPGAFMTVVIAVILCIVFFAYFRMHYKWEMNEQLYKELKSKAAKTEQASNSSINTSS